MISVLALLTFNLSFKFRFTVPIFVLMLAMLGFHAVGVKNVNPWRNLCASLLYFVVCKISSLKKVHARYLTC